jgi:hypothetical protein
MVVSPSYDQSKLIFDMVARLLLGSPHTRRHVKSVKTPYPRIEYMGSLIMARTADEDGRNLRGHSADRVIVDEAAYVRDAVIEEVIAPMLADRDGKLILISTPFGKNHFYRAYVLGADCKSPPIVGADDLGAGPGKPAPGDREQGSEDRERRAAFSGAETLDTDPQPPAPTRYASFRFPSWDNPHISRTYIEHQRSVLTERQFAVEYEAEFLDDQAAVFTWADIEGAMGLWLPKSVELGYRTAGVDWARYSDYTVVAVLETGREPHHLVAIDRFNAIGWEEQIRRVVDFLVRHQVNSVLTDQTSIGDPLLEQLKNALWAQQANIGVEGFCFTGTSKREIIDNLVLQFAHRRIALPNDERLTRELQYFEYELTTGGNIRMNARSGYTDDCVIALALAAWQARNAAWSREFFAAERDKLLNHG